MRRSYSQQRVVRNTPVVSLISAMARSAHMLLQVYHGETKQIVAKKCRSATNRYIAVS